MKRLLFAITFVLLIYSAGAQNATYDKRLLSKFSEKELQEMERKSPETFNYWNYYSANAFQVMDLAAEKSVAHEIKGTLQISNINAINIFDLKLTPAAKDYQYYKIEGTQKLLVILSEEQIKVKFAKSPK